MHSLLYLNETFVYIFTLNVCNVYLKSYTLMRKHILNELHHCIREWNNSILNRYTESITCKPCILSFCVNVDSAFASQSQIIHSEWIWITIAKWLIWPKRGKEREQESSVIERVKNRRAMKSWRLLFSEAWSQNDNKRPIK